jgi:hypothetical protein
VGKNLHYTIPRYLEEALDKHANVTSWDKIDSKDHYIYRVKRDKGLSDIIVHLSDEYEYTLDDYFQKSEEQLEESFILIAKPEAKYDDSIVEIATQDKISIGKFGALMGAIYVKEHWSYVPKERREEN